MVVYASSFGDYVELATTQIVLYGTQDPAVIDSLRHFVGALQRLDLSEMDSHAVDVLAEAVSRGQR